MKVNGRKYLRRLNFRTGPRLSTHFGRFAPGTL